MEMEMEVKDEMSAQVERLAVAAEALERVLAREVMLSAAGGREAELEEKLRVAEATIAGLRASASTRKTAAGGVASLMAKHGVGDEALEMGALDAALVSLSVEQRIAVKAQMMRSGLVG